MPGSVPDIFVLQEVSYCRPILRARRASPIRPVPSNSMLVGSGTCGGVGPGGVAVVPNWTTTLLNVELAVTPATDNTNVAVPLRNGLCGLFPAMLPLALA